jgi:hypothetical protein
MSKGIIALAFSIGAAIGAAVSWRLLKKKYEQIAHDEIEEMREYYREKETNLLTVDDQNQDEQRNIKAMDILKAYRSEALKTDKKGDADDMPDPYVISPDDFGEHIYYDTTFWTYYADGVLADEMDEPVTDIDIVNTVGKDFAEHIGRYEPDVIHIRNDAKKTDYEIIVDAMNYSDINERNSHLMVDE